MKTKFFLCLMIPIIAITFVFANFSVPINCESLKVKVITKSISVYQNADVESEVLGKAEKDKVFEVVEESGEFYKIQYETSQGYVLKAYTMDVNNKQLEIYIDTNAVLITDSNVYKLVDGDYKKIDGLTLKKNDRVKVLNGIDKSQPYTKISFNYNGEVVTYFADTESINVDGINLRIVVAIMIIVSCVTLFLIFYSFFKGKKKIN